MIREVFRASLEKDTDLDADDSSDDGALKGQPVARMQHGLLCDAARDSAT